MKTFKTFAGGLGAGAALIALFAALTAVWKPDVVAAWLERDTGQTRSRRSLERAERLARLAPDYLDLCRSAGL